MEREAILERIETAWQEFRQALEGIPAERAGERGVCDDWSVKDIVAHIASWENCAATTIEGIESVDGGGDLTIDEINAQDYERISELSYQDALAELERSHARIVAVARAAEDLGPDQVEGDTWEHYEEHGNQIRQWRSREGV